jgi:anaerobic selenocysteine-containing dehydrogenase
LERPYIFNSANNSNVLVGGERALPSKIEGEYERWTDFDFWRGLGVRLGQEEYWPWKTDEEAYDARLAPLGLNFKEFMEKGGIDVTLSGFKKHEKHGFATPTGKIELKSTIFEKLGYDPLPRYIEPRESPVSTPELAEKYPLILMTGGRILPYYHSEHRQIDSFRKKRPDPVLQMNAETARKLGIKDGDWVWIETPRGTVKQKCEYAEGMHPRCVHAEHSWWFPEEPGEEPWLHGCWESNINVCMDDDPDVCNAMIGAWPLRTALCKVYKCKHYK